MERKTWYALCDSFIEDLIATIKTLFLIMISFDYIGEIIAESPEGEEGFLLSAGGRPKRRVESRKTMLELALHGLEEAEDGHSRIQSLLLIGIWGSFDAMIEDLLVAWITHNPSVIETETIAAARRSARSAATPGGEDFRGLVARMRQRMRSEGGGVSTSEALLAAFDLGGEVEEDVRTVLNKAQILRNVFAHKKGTADADFLRRWPGDEYSQGDPIKLSFAQFDEILDGFTSYTRNIKDRCRLK